MSEQYAGVWGAGFLLLCAFAVPAILRLALIYAEREHPTLEIVDEHQAVPAVAGSVDEGTPVHSRIVLLEQQLRAAGSRPRLGPAIRRGAPGRPGEHRQQFVLHALS